MKKRWGRLQSRASMSGNIKRQRRAMLPHSINSWLSGRRRAPRSGSGPSSRTSQQVDRSGRTFRRCAEMVDDYRRWQRQNRLGQAEAASTGPKSQWPCGQAGSDRAGPRPPLTGPRPLSPPAPQPPAHLAGTGGPGQRPNDSSPPTALHLTVPHYAVDTTSSQIHWHLNLNSN